jgi:hypothetical protein
MNFAQHFLEGRVRLVRELMGGGIKVHRADLILIICAVISACAARRWPGRDIDRKRFLELLVKHSSDESRISWVSVPTLINSGLITENKTRYENRGEAGRNYRDDEIDLCFGEAEKKYRHITFKDLKKCTYASLIYEWLRCGYAHEYCERGDTTPVGPASGETARITYFNRLTNGGVTHMAHFHLGYLLGLASHHVSILPSDPSPYPPVWWVDET